MVDAVAELTWRVFPASVMMVVGVGVVLFGLRVEIKGIRLSRDDASKMITVVQGFRIAVIGLALAGVGASWNWNILWLFVLSLAFGGEEIMESSVHLFILRRRPPHWPKSKANQSVK